MYASVSAGVFIMERRVLIILMLFIIIKDCFASANGIEKHLEAIADEPSSRIQSCLRNIIEHIWDPSESLVFTISSHPDYLPVNLPNPVTVVDIRNRFPMNYKRYEVNYIIEADRYELVTNMLNLLLASSLWHNKESPRGKFVILTKEEEKLPLIFWGMWRYLSVLHILVVIYDDTSKNRPTKIIMYNPHMQGNRCGRAPTVFSNYTCDNISIEFLKPVRNYNKCPVIISSPYDYTAFDFNKMTDVVMWNILVHMDLMLNVTMSYQSLNDDQFNNVLSQRDIAIYQFFFGKVTACDNSMIFMRRKLAWVGPKIKEMSSMKVLFRPFTYDMWLAVVLMIILFIFLRWVIIRNRGYNSHWYNLASAFTDIIGLTFGVGINRIPNIASLKIVIGFYLIYLIHIHTAYTSDLINHLVMGEYEGIISSVEKVAKSGIPIYMPNSISYNYFNGDTHNSSLLSKIKKLIRSYTSDNLSSIDSTKSFIVMLEDNFALGELSNKMSRTVINKLHPNMFLSSSLSGDVKSVFLLKNGSYFTESLNSVITYLYESGLYFASFPVKYNPRFPMYHQYSLPKVEMVLKMGKYEQIKNWKGSLSLKHLMAIFVTFIVCLVFSTIVFIAEILIHKIF